MSARPASAKACRRLIKVLEAAAAEGEDGRVSSVASWLLAAACADAAAATAAAEAGSSSSSRAAGAAVGHADRGEAAGRPIPLSSYPETGAHRPMVEALTALSLLPSASGSATMATAAACARCLAASPRLPSADWGGICRRLWHRAAAASSLPVRPGSEEAEEERIRRLELLEAVAELAVAHGSETSHGLAVFLDDALSEPEPLLAAAAGALAALLLRLPRALPVLAGSRRAPALAAAVRAAAKAAGRGTEEHALLAPLAALCSALAELHRAASGGKKATPPVGSPLVLEHTSAVLALLPPLPALMPGEVAVMRAALSSSHGAQLPLPMDKFRARAGDEEEEKEDEMKDGFGSRLELFPRARDDGGRRDLMLLWCHAARCTAAAGPAGAAEAVAAAAKEDGTGGSEEERAAARLRVLQMRCLLVLAGTCSYRDLAVCRCENGRTGRRPHFGINV